MHSCGGPEEVSYCKVRIMDAGGGDYLVIDADEWALDFSEIDELAQFLKDLLQQNTGE